MNNTQPKKATLLFGNKEYDKSIITITVLMIIVLMFINPQYRSVNNYMNILREASFVGVGALGMMSIIMTCNTDLSIGTMMALASVITLKIMPTVGLIPSIIICILCCVILSTINGFLTVYCKILAFILTLGMQYVYKGVAFTITNQKIVAATNFNYTQIANFNLFSGKEFDGIPLPFIIYMVIAAVTYILIHKTGYGRKIYAIGNSQKAAELAGINVKKTKLITYIFLGIYVGISAILISSRLWMASAEMRTGFEFDVITIVVMGGVAFSGGKGNVINTVVSSIFFAMIYNVINLFNVDPYWQYIVRAALLILAFSISNIRNAIESRIERKSYRIKNKNTETA